MLGAYSLVGSIKDSKRLIRMIKNYQLYIFILPMFLYFVIFKYIPMYGIQIAFRDYIATRVFTGSPFVGFEHFERFFRSPDFLLLIKNTVGLSLYQLIAGFPLPIFVALLLNHLNKEKFKRFTQTVIYAPHFISTVVLVGMLYVFLSPRSGLVNQIITALGGAPIFFMARSEWFKTLYVLSGIWQNTGWGTIVYLAALSSISQELHEAAVVDGANKWRRIWHIDIPGLMPTAIILLILNMGSVMNIGFEKAYLMQTVLNRTSSEIISTYVYKIGLLGAQYSFSGAVGLFDAVINLTILATVNKIAKRVTEVSLW